MMRVGQVEINISHVKCDRLPHSPLNLKSHFLNIKYFPNTFLVFRVKIPRYSRLFSFSAPLRLTSLKSALTFYHFIT